MEEKSVFFSFSNLKSIITERNVLRWRDTRVSIAIRIVKTGTVVVGTVILSLFLVWRAKENKIKLHINSYPATVCFCIVTVRKVPDGIVYLRGNETETVNSRGTCGGFNNSTDCVYYNGLVVFARVDDAAFNTYRFLRNFVLPGKFHSGYGAPLPYTCRRVLDH